WTGSTPQDGWTITDNEGNDETWAFDDPGGRGNLTGGAGNFAAIDSYDYGYGSSQDTTLVSPVSDLSDATSPEIAFGTYLTSYSTAVADVDLSVDGGETWTNVWKRSSGHAEGYKEVPIPDAAGQPSVQFRFHYTGEWPAFWQLDDVFIGNRACDPVKGGLVAGVVTDDNTGAGVTGAKVASDDSPDNFAISAATSDDANLPDGFYWLFSPHTGATDFTVTSGRYTPASGTVDVAGDYVAHQDWALAAGHLTVDPGSISVSERLGRHKTHTVTFTNDGTSPVHVNLSERDNGFTPMNGAHQDEAPGAPTKKIKGDFPIGSMAHYAKVHPRAGSHLTGNGGKVVTPGTVQLGTKTVQLKKRAVQLRQPMPAVEPWTDIADYPTPIMTNAAAYNDGRLYSMMGYTGSADTDAAFVYDAASQQWSAIADAPFAGEEARAAFANGTMYLVGGWGPTETQSTTYAYDPASDSWTQMEDLPTAVAAEGLANVGGKLYAVGGCTTLRCIPAVSTVQVYDPASDSWTQVADYPTTVAFPSCAGVDGQLVCAGGNDANAHRNLTATYIYDPASDSWTQGADMPTPLWGSAVGASGGKMQVATGVGDGTVTNEAFEYDPAADAWTELPNANNAVFRGSGACGLYQVGGATPEVFGSEPHPWSELLPGYGQCGPTGVSWLSEDMTEFDVAPGQSVSVRVLVDSGVVSQPGDYMGSLAVITDSPYSMEPVGVTMHVQPPRSWGKITGTVTDAASGDPIPGTAVQICTMLDRTSGQCGPVTYTLKTDAEGRYQLWLNKGYNPLEIIAAKDGYQPKVTITRLHKGETTVANFALHEV
ncbi:MAG: kelch repeat-containing protein, partial [Nocardioidaceae bacterium]